MQPRLTVFLPLTFVLTIVCFAVKAQETTTIWSSFSTIAAGASQSIGSYTNGCLQGGAELPLNGTGYQVMRVSRHRYFGHPDLVAYIRHLGELAAAESLGTLLIGDLGQPRGGPMLSGHRSHQSGLDVDIWFWLLKGSGNRRLTDNERESLQAISVADTVANTLDQRNWTSTHARILEIAAQQTEVDRIFVNPSIKRELCHNKSSASRHWLRKIRPWWKHDDHFHVRLKCPAHSLYCETQEALPEGDGCDASLDWWFSAEARQPPAKPSVPPPPLPQQCLMLLYSDL